MNMNVIVFSGKSLNLWKNGDTAFRTGVLF